MESHCEATEAAAKVLCYQGSNLLWGQSTEGFHGWSNNTMLGWVRPTLGQRYSHKSTGREVGWVNHRDLTGFILLPASFFGQQWTYCTVSMRYKQQCDKKRQEIKTGRERMVLIDRVWQWLFYFILFFPILCKTAGEKKSTTTVNVSRAFKQKIINTLWIVFVHTSSCTTYLRS